MSPSMSRAPRAAALRDCIARVVQRQRLDGGGGDSVSSASSALIDTLKVSLLCFNDDWYLRSAGRQLRLLGLLGRRRSGRLVGVRRDVRLLVLLVLLVVGRHGSSARKRCGEACARRRCGVVARALMPRCMASDSVWSCVSCAERAGKHVVVKRTRAQGLRRFTCPWPTRGAPEVRRAGVYTLNYELHYEPFQL